ncbi:cell wall-binding protein [Bacillus swezeyi]|uniref:Cell wall-binding protein n=1 Tax=Bacillus swezeyi TaxID=1925020 RepID=A0A5M8S042_9BACI|nr:cell wall-binding protein [Bacillus swezeyi]KAA6453078.1 cell wall-binding protein [Bacillus swezeyi]KAA6476304.1 cell wall-binding protein [Bacillus swezeyi]
MKLKFGIIITLIFSMALAMMPTEKAEAAMGRWDSLGKGCKVRVWVDAYTYTKKASSIDWYAQTNGKCGTLKYTARIAISEGYLEYQMKGSFSKRTPVKKFPLSKLRKEGPRRKDVTVDVLVSNPSKGIHGFVSSHDIIVNW